MRISTRALVLRTCSLLPLFASPFVTATWADAPDQDAQGAEPAAREAALARSSRPVEFDARAAEHLLSRAGFGATQADVRAAVELGLEGTLDRLLAGDPTPREPWSERLVGIRAVNDELKQLPRVERQRRNRDLRRRDSAQLAEWRDWWIDRLVENADPLRERMVLFWHGHFPSAMSDVGNGHELIQQNRLFRSHALGSARELTRRIARDAAMLEYLDNDENRKKKPNENFARELLELFTLGEGFYTEEDVRDVARSFTGWTDVEGSFVLRKNQHDTGRKTFLGVTDNLGGDDVLAILFDSPRCAEYLATEIITYLEGRAPDELRAERYARLYAECDFDTGALLRALFSDPDFYRAEVVGTRIASPLDYLVGSSIRLGVDPPAEWVGSASRALGEALFEPPTVEGWPGGEAWITTASLMLRGNLAGILCGALDPEDLVPVDTEASGPKNAKASGNKALAALDGDLRRLIESGWRANPNVGQLVRTGGTRLDGQIVRALCAEVLAVEVGEATLVRLVRELRAERVLLGPGDGTLLENPSQAEPVLRRLAHLVLSLPEAQLH